MLKFKRRLNELNRLTLWLSFIFTLNSTWGVGQGYNSIPIPVEEEQQFFLLEKKDTLLLIGKTEHWRIVDNRLLPFYLNDSKDQMPINFIEYTPVATKDTFYFVENGLGKVYQLDTIGFNRVDKSTSLHNNFGNSVFLHNNRLYSYGGYGFWNFHDYILHMSEQTKEWEIVTINTGYIPTGRSKHFFKKKRDGFIAFGGEGDKGFLNDAFEYNFKSNDFTSLGEVNKTFPFTNRTRFSAVYNQSSYYWMHDFKFLKINWEENSFQHTLSNERFASHIPISNFIIFNDSLRFISNKTGIYRFNSIALTEVDRILSAPEQLFFPKTSNFLQQLFLFLTLLGGLFVIYILFHLRRLKKTTPLLQRRYLTYKKSIVILTEEEKSILLLLNEKAHCSLTQISQLAFYNEYSKSYQQAAARKDLKSLQLKIETDKRISKKLSFKVIYQENDRRQISYRLKGKLVNYRGWINHYIRF